jgi:hypothetical protein
MMDRYSSQKSKRVRLMVPNSATHTMGNSYQESKRVRRMVENPRQEPLETILMAFESYHLSW